jgi:hypothetical protein
VTTAKLHIRSAVDLAAALRSPEVGVRLTLLKAIADNPESANAYGTHEGRDLIDELITLAAEVRAGTLWKAILIALAALQDARVTVFFQQTLGEQRPPDILFMAADRLAREPLEPMRGFLTGLLLGDGSIAHARAVAALVAELDGLGVAERIRLALILREEGPVAPRLNRETADRWCAELNGPFSPQARDALELQGQAAFLLLKGRAATLVPESRAWLLRWGAERWPDDATDLLVQALESGDDRLAATALECLARWEAPPACLRPTLSALASDRENPLRTAAVRAGGDGVDWRQAVATDPDPAFRLACLARLVTAQGPAAIPFLATLLAESDWTVRAAATEALIGAGPAAVEVVRPHIRDPDPAVRASTVRILSELGEDEWLEATLLA